jgi:hypothetical protein
MPKVCQFFITEKWEVDERIDVMTDNVVDSWMRGLSRSSGLLDEKTRWMSDSNGLLIVFQL